MKIAGLQKTTLLDYPGKVAATVFLSGCNLKCPYCHNSELINSKKNIVKERELFSYLKKRQGVLDGVCITGGEPTLQKGIIGFIATIKEMGYLVKLDTNGFDPHTLSILLDHKLLDYCAIDIIILHACWFGKISNYIGSIVFMDIDVYIYYRNNQKRKRTNKNSYRQNNN